jgi:hypothetical protein
MLWEVRGEFKVLGHNGLTTTPSLAQSKSGHNPHPWFSLPYEACVSVISHAIKLVHVKNYVEMNGNLTNKKGDFPHRWLQIGEGCLVKALFLGNQG